MSGTGRQCLALDIFCSRNEIGVIKADIHAIFK
jgi:hypothetical protein